MLSPEPRAHSPQPRIPTGGRLCIITGLAFLCFLSSPSLAGEEHVYDAGGKRDPFMPLVGVTAKKQTAGSLEDVVSIDEVMLRGVARDSAGQRFAILNDEVVREGQTVGRVTVKSIVKNKVKILIDNEEYKLEMYEEEGGTNE